ncbi:MAG: hypothetical protein K0R12_797 [Gammaproteobacteria bacterium]|jgi:hypothetical protein|nr:hypothetical protein [Gammaproteobacteria bacterium]
MRSFRTKPADAFKSYASTLSEDVSSVSFRTKPADAFKSYFSTIMQPKAEKASLLGKAGLATFGTFSHKIQQSIQPEMAPERAVENSFTAAASA